MNIITCQAADGRWNYGPADNRAAMELEEFGTFDTEAAARAAAGERAIDTPARRLQAWAEICTGGAMNLITIDGVSWSWTTQPRIQKNGAAIGRVHAQRRGELMRDVGSYKIDAGGRVVHLPDELRAVLPGGLEAAIAAPESIEEPAP